MSDIAQQVDKARDAFRRYGIQVSTNVEKAVNEVCLMIERDAKLAFRPRTEDSWDGSPPRVQTNRARAAITHRVKREAFGNVVGETGLSVGYAIDLELGTSTTYPHPFMEPAYEKNKEEGIQKINDAIIAAAKETF